MAKSKLLKLAQRLGLRGISTMNKPELIETIRRAKQRRAVPLRKRAVVVVAQKTVGSVKRRAMRKPKVSALSKKAKVAGKSPATSKKATAASISAATGQAAHKFDVAPAKAKQSLKQVFPTVTFYMESV